MHAAENGHTTTVQALLDAGANAGHKCKDGRTALSIAKKNKHEEVVKCLRFHDAIS